MLCARLARRSTSILRPIFTSMAGRHTGEGSQTDTDLVADSAYPKTCCKDDVEVTPCIVTVKHDKKDQLFYIDINEGHATSRALLQYSSEQSGVVDLWHTEVPSAFRGKGVAKILAKAAFEYVVIENLKMKLSCTYLQKYYKDNPLPQYTERVVPLS